MYLHKSYEIPIHSWTVNQWKTILTLNLQESHHMIVGGWICVDQDKTMLEVTCTKKPK